MFFITDLFRKLYRDTVLAKNFVRKCTKGMSGSVLSVLVYTTGKIAKIACKNKKERNNYITKGNCGNVGKNRTMKCWNELIAIATNIKKLKDNKEKLPSVCWYVLFESCFGFH